MTIEEIKEQIAELARINAEQADDVLDIKARLRRVETDVEDLKAWARRMKE